MLRVDDFQCVDVWADIVQIVADPFLFPLQAYQNHSLYRYRVFTILESIPPHYSGSHASSDTISSRLVVCFYNTGIRAPPPPLTPTTVSSHCSNITIQISPYPSTHNSSTFALVSKFRKLNFYDAAPWTDSSGLASQSAALQGARRDRRKRTTRTGSAGLIRVAMRMAGGRICAWLPLGGR